ncbi:MAG: hypothetical protein GF317_20965 [Candidatus Lokiarchaeota archaeon]|nr:hypothetical protein [Candidatus Lokiarchaeota archaeon]MBD3201916.1 hypothetical protein [Candidatus Lokiarchaeota archaeon]
MRKTNLLALQEAFNKVSGVGETRMSIRIEFCPECYFDYQSEKFGTKGRKKKLAIQGAILIIFLSILIIMSPGLSDLQGPNRFFMLIPFFILLFIVIFVSLGILSYVFWTPKKQKDIEKEKENFFKTVKKEFESPLENPENCTCHSCGNKISSNQKIRNFYGIEL